MALKTVEEMMLECSLSLREYGMLKVDKSSEVTKRGKYNQFITSDKQAHKTRLAADNYQLLLDCHNSLKKVVKVNRLDDASVLHNWILDNKEELKIMIEKHEFINQSI